VFPQPENPLKTLLAAVLLLGLVVPAQAQTSSPRFGTGVSLDMTPTSGFSLDGGFNFDARTGNLHFPVRISRSIRLEPTLGYARETREQSDPSSSSEGKFSVLRVGLGIMFLLPRGESFLAYAGARVGLRRRTQEITNRFTGFPSTTSRIQQTDKFLSAVFGGEYFLAPYFSLGGEAQVTYMAYGEPDVDTDPPQPGPQLQFDGSSLATAGLIVIRWYPGGRAE
jgi:hypothetical protein